MSRPDDSTHHDTPVLGHAPRPATGEQLDSFLRDLLVRSSTGTSGSVDGLDGVLIESHMEGADIARLLVDVTGVVVAPGTTTDDPASEPMLSAITRTEAATLRALEVRAHPITIAGVAFTLAATANDVPFAWLEDDRSRVGIAEHSRVEGRARVHARAEANHGALVAGIEELLTEQLAGTVAISDLEVELTKTGERAASVAVSARVRKGILSASAEFTGTASIDDDMVLRVTDAQVSSRNPLVAGLLLAVRDRIEAAVAEPIPLNQWSPRWLQLRDIQFEFGEQLVVELDFA